MAKILRGLENMGGTAEERRKFIFPSTKETPGEHESCVPFPLLYEREGELRLAGQTGGKG